MAIMYSGAVDWSFDLALADAKKVRALPLAHGVSASKNATLGEQLFIYLKTLVKFYGQSDTPWDDAWEREIDWSYVSDWYKDAYGQRPHFDKWYWRGLLGVYQSIVDFKSNEAVMQEQAKFAKSMRDRLEAMAKEELL